MTDTDIRYDFTERMGICIHQGGLSETQAHEIASEQVRRDYGQAGAEWLKLEAVKRLLV